MNSYYSLEETIPDSELRHINFFNGRLLSGEDLSAEREATHAHMRYLGRAVGAGIACGLEVSRAQNSPPADVQVTVKAGLAVNKAGQTLRLACDQTVSLVRPLDPAKKADCVFSDCELVVGTTLSGDGYYLLTIAPASEREGLAPVSGLGNTPAACNSRYFAEGIQFRLLPLNVDAGKKPDLARNIVAYQCFGLADITSNDEVQSALDRTVAPSYGVEALVPTAFLTARDVPLAVIEWKTGGMGFVDQWSVRRRISKSAAASFWEPLIGDRRLAEGEAMFLQFQDQIEDFVNSGSPLSQITAKEQFAYLPPVGFVPLATAGFPNGFDPGRFFAGFTVRQPLFLEGRRMCYLIDIARGFAPIDTSSAELVWLYSIRENAMAVDSKSPPQQSVILFASAALPFLGEARFDFSRWQYATFD
jgi:hypothetical protein